MSNSAVAQSTNLLITATEIFVVPPFLLWHNLLFASVVNLVVNQPVVPEFLQWQATPEAIAAAALDLLQNEAARQTMRAGYAKMRAELGPPGACQRTADLILEALVEGAGAEPSG